MYCMAVAAWGGALEEQARARPAVDDGTVLMRVTHCGLCHSDLHIQDGHFDMGGGAKLELPRELLPLVMGHEPEGVIEAIGAGAAVKSPHLREGQRVAVYPWIGCGACAACKRGEQQICVGANRGLGTRLAGGFSTHLCVPDSAALIPLETLAPGIGGAAMCSGLTAFSAYNKVRAHAPGEPLVLIGLGGVGLMGLAVAKALHDGPVIAIDVDEAKRNAALERGAARAIDPTQDGAVASFVAETGGAGAAIDFVGNPASFGVATQIVRRGGAAVFVGLYGGAAALPIATLPLRALWLIGSYVGSLDEARDLIALLESGQITAPPVASRPLREINTAIADLRAGRVIGRIALQP
jgi:D-arabinose 1-dehydrogenase-like Zn-dependent alcohol dehydrogenase